MLIAQYNLAVVWTGNTVRSPFTSRNSWRGTVALTDSCAELAVLRTHRVLLLRTTVIVGNPRSNDRALRSGCTDAFNAGKPSEQEGGGSFFERLDGGHRTRGAMLSGHRCFVSWRAWTRVRCEGGGSLFNRLSKPSGHRRIRLVKIRIFLFCRIL